MKRRRLPAAVRFLDLAMDGFLATERGDWVTAGRILAVLRLDPLYLYVRIDRELPYGQARVVRLLLDEGDEVPASYRWVAETLGVGLGTVHTHLRRVRRRHPDLYAAVMERRREHLARYHAAVAERRRRRSLTWGRRRAAARYRAEHGEWPWEAYRRLVLRTG